MTIPIYTTTMIQLDYDILQQERNIEHVKLNVKKLKEQSALHLLLVDIGNEKLNNERQKLKDLQNTLNEEISLQDSKN